MTHSAYNVNCLSCKTTFDALRAPWCDCLVKERSFVCPHCGKCFCKAPFAERRKFWADAPQEVWDRKLAEKSAVSEWTNPHPDEVRRPLVLLVDDEPDIRTVAQRVIVEAGFGLVMAKDGREGLDLAALYRPEVVLTDVMMPKIDGREMAVKIKTDPATSKARVIMMTSLYTDPRYKYEALRDFKADDYVSKPLDVTQLLAVLVKHTS